MCFTVAPGVVRRFPDGWRRGWLSLGKTDERAERIRSDEWRQDNTSSKRSEALHVGHRSYPYCASRALAGCQRRVLRQVREHASRASASRGRVGQRPHATVRRGPHRNVERDQASAADGTPRRRRAIARGSGPAVSACTRRSMPGARTGRLGASGGLLGADSRPGRAYAGGCLWARAGQRRRWRGVAHRATLTVVSNRIQCEFMYSLRQTLEFQRWLDALKDMRAQVRIVARLRLAEAGNLGDWKPVGGDVSEMRVDVGPGYRLYFTRKGNFLIVMLAGGGKSTQDRDIKRAQRILRQLELEP